MKKLEKKCRDDSHDGGVLFQGPVHTSKCGKQCFFGWKMAIKYRKNQKKNRDGLVMMLREHCFQGPTCISKYGNICISRWKTGIIGKKLGVLANTVGWCIQGPGVDVQKGKY